MRSAFTSAAKMHAQVTAFRRKEQLTLNAACRVADKATPEMVK